MKVNIINREGAKTPIGQLQVSAVLMDKTKDKVQYATFPIETLFDWYPLSPNYSYKYSERHNLYYLRIIPEGTVINRYGLADNKEISVKNRPAMGKTLYTGESDWYNPAVKAENLEVFRFAKLMGMHTPEEPYTLEMVEHNQSILQKALDGLYAQCSQWYQETESLTAQEAEDQLILFEGETYRRYQLDEVYTIEGTDDEKRAEHVLSHLTENEIELYYRLGEVYTMICLMRKVAKAGG